MHVRVLQPSDAIINGSQKLCKKYMEWIHLLVALSRFNFQSPLYRKARDRQGERWGTAATQSLNITSLMRKTLEHVCVCGKTTSRIVMLLAAPSGGDPAAGNGAGMTYIGKGHHIWSQSRWFSVRRPCGRQATLSVSKGSESDALETRARMTTVRVANCTVSISMSRVLMLNYVFR